MFRSINLETLNRNTSAQTRNGVEKLCRVILAGPIAQRKFHPKGWRQVHGSGDRAHVTDLLRCWNAVGYDEKLSTAYRGLFEIQTQRLIEKHWHCVGYVEDENE